MLKDKTFRASGAKKYQIEICGLAVGDPLHVMEDYDRFWCYELVTHKYETVGYVPASHWVSDDVRAGRQVLHASVASIDTNDEGDFRIKVRVVTGDDADTFNLPIKGPGTYSVNVAGESYRQDQIRRCTVGEPVKLFHDSKNAHDPRAIAVFSARDEQIGFLPRDGWLTRALLDDGATYAAQIGAIHQPSDSRPFFAVVLAVALQ